MPEETPKKNKGWELLAVFVLGGAAGFYVSRMFKSVQADNGNPGHLPESNQHWHSNKLQITAPGYAPRDTSDAQALAELGQPELEQPDY